MKDTSYSEILLLQVTAFTLLLMITSCSNDSQKLEDPLDKRVKHIDAKFLVKASNINIEEIQLGILAQEKGRNTHVKELGKMMEDAHEQSQRALTDLARAKLVTIPTSPSSDTRDAYAKLNNKIGNNFDRSYADKMVSVHRDAITAFEKASKNCNDPDIKNWAAATLHDMRSQLDYSIACQEKFDKKYTATKD